MYIKWLHISDIHFSYPGFDTALARKDLIREIQQTSVSEAFTDLFVTGDVLFQNAASSTDTISFLHDIVTAMRISKDHVWIVPGNHDHNRELCKSTYDCIYGAEDTGFAVDQLADGVVDDLANSFSNYKQFVDAFFGDEDIYVQRKLHWISRLRGSSSIFGLNTAWLENGTRDDPYIRIGLKQMPVIIIDSGLDGDAENIAIGHHPLDDLHSNEQAHVLALFQRNNIKTYLCGHKHGAGAKYYSDYDVLQINAAGLLVDGYSYGGYCIGIIDTDIGVKKAEFFRWKLTDKHWQRDCERSGVNVDGVCNFEIIRQNKKISNLAVDAKLLNGPTPDDEIYSALNDQIVEIIRFKTSNITGKISDEQWRQYRNELVGVTDTAIMKRDNMRFSIYPMAPIPLLIEMGYLFQHNSNILIWQYNRECSKWVRFDRCPENYTLNMKESLLRKAGRLIVSVATSAPVYEGQITPFVPVDNNDMICFVASELRVGYPLDSSVVEKFAEDIVSKVRSVVWMYNEVHLFFAIPAGLAVEIGRRLQSNMFPKVLLYHYQAGYHYAYAINEA